MRALNVLEDMVEGCDRVKGDIEVVSPVLPKILDLESVVEIRLGLSFKLIQ